MQYRTGRTKTSAKRPLILVGSLLLLLIAIVGALQLSGKVHLFSKPVQPVASGSAGATKGEPKTAAQAQTAEPANSPAASSSAKSTSTTNSATFTGTLLAPSGDFVSAHHVTANTPISSVCTTTTGATCKIIFKNGTTTKSLTEEMSDSNGSVYWNAWTPASLGLTAGDWQIEAIAAGGQQTKSSIDALPLEVSP